MAKLWGILRLMLIHMEGGRQGSTFMFTEAI